MNQMTPPPKIEIIPSSAPFSEAQRSWLNGFFAGLLTEGPTPLSVEQGAAAMQPHLFVDARPPQVHVAALGDLGGAIGAALLIA